MSPPMSRGPAAPAPATQPPRLSRGAGTTLAEQLGLQFAQRIAQRVLPPGARLPSVRDCARRQGVSTATVVAAYDQLQAQGLIEARPQRGFFVRGRHLATPLPRAPAAGGPPPAPVDATALIRSMFQNREGPASPGMGTLPEDWLDAGVLQRALRQASSPAAAASWLRYGEPAGHLGLRQALSRRLADTGIAASPAQIVTTLGATHALDIVSRTLLRPGDAVLVDEPGWAVEYARLTRMGLRLLPVPRGAEGPDLAAFDALAREHAPRVYITVSVLHNPTGASLSPAAAHRVLQLAAQHGLLIVEDDTYAWLAPAHATRMAQLDALERTIYVSGFSKVLVPQWRIGFIAASPALAERFVDTKLLATLTTPAVLEDAMARLLDKGTLRRHAERVLQRLDGARERTARLVRDAGMHFAAAPQGLFGWVDVGADTEQLAQPMFDEGWLIAPGSLFHATPRPTTLMRVNFAAGQDARFWRCLCGLTRKRRGGPGSLPHRGVVSSADGSAALTRAHN